ncbi:craniofacial development protein 2-like [Harmonia axyridis]|uniref:craniofacial development protein 2-like n=1 Tax=Harmonia axyridis TaxID=115357 RepID=UPI001E279D3B|nr:craniofacial development protein 2-like [Harmonia axyridis]
MGTKEKPCLWLTINDTTNVLSLRKQELRKLTGALTGHCPLRILQTSFKLQDTVTTHIISVYAPDITKPSDEKEAFYEDLQKVLDRIPRMEEVILLGDFNARVGNGVIGGLKNRFNEETINENGERLIQTCAQNELRVNNTFFPHKSQHKFTFENSRGQKSVIDYVITNKNIHPSKILDVRVLSPADTITGHNLVLAKIRNEVQRGSKTKPTQIKKLNNRIVV